MVIGVIYMSDKGRGTNVLSRMAKDFGSAFEARGNVHIGICEFYRNKEGDPKDQQDGIKHTFCGPKFLISQISIFCPTFTST